MGVSKESISKFLIGNRFLVKLRILSPENCKQSLRVKSWKAEATAEKKQSAYSPHLLTLTQKEKKLNPKAMITCKRPTTIGQKLTNYKDLALN